MRKSVVQGLSRAEIKRLYDLLIDPTYDNSIGEVLDDQAPSLTQANTIPQCIKAWTGASSTSDCRPNLANLQASAKQMVVYLCIPAELQSQI